MVVILLHLHVMKFITLDNQSSISIHGYCVQDSCHILVSLLIEHIVEKSNAQKLTKVILTAIVNFGGLTEKEIANRLLCKWCAYILGHSNSNVII